MKIGAALSFVTLALLAYHASAAAQVDADEPERSIPLFDEGRLLATGGISSVEGSAGGGLANWAVIGGYGTGEGIGVTAHETFVGLRSFNLNSVGTAIGLYNRLELSYARQAFDTRDTGAALGLGKGYTFDENVYGAKLRLFGDLVYDQDWLPQTAIGLQYKANEQSNILKAVGAKSSDGVDFYASATKLLLAESVLVSGSVRLTRANQFGILGFGGPKNDAYQPEFEGSAAYLLSKRFAIGAEYRTKPDNLGFAAEQNAYDAFAAYFINKNASITLAYVDLGTIATRRDQDGIFASLQVGF